MTHITLDGKFETSQEAIQNVLGCQVAKLVGKYDLTPVVVSQKIAPRKTSYGVQFWTADEIKAGTGKNSDGSISTYCAH